MKAKRQGTKNFHLGLPVLVMSIDHHIKEYSESVFWWIQMKWKNEEDLLSGLFLKIIISKTWNEPLSLTTEKGKSAVWDTNRKCPPMISDEIFLLVDIL